MFLTGGDECPSENPPPSEDPEKTFAGEPETNSMKIGRITYV
jgi:hypothetical protein